MFIASRRRESTYLAVLLLVMFITWIGFTHLQGRFFILAIPILAMLIGLVQPDLAVPWTSLVAIGSIIGLVVTHWQLAGFDRRVSLHNIIAIDRLDGLTPVEPAQLPANAHVVLIGDARAFLYSLPSARLHYKTVFDVVVSPGQSVVDAWRAGTESLAPPVIEVIDPSELTRFSRTYQGIAPPPAEVAAHREPYLVWREH